MLQRLRLGKKFTILLLGVFLGSILLSGMAFSRVLNQNAQNQLMEKALVLMQTMNSIRTYTSTQINPELQSRLAEEFLPESVPAYSAREVFEALRGDPAYQEFFYKEATLNPTNLRDKADDFEVQLVEQFQQSPDLAQVSGFRTAAGGKLFYVARPIQVKEQSCLQCHSTPDVAPVSMIERYGDANGFNWQLNEIVGAQMISVPARQVIQSATKAFALLMSILVGIFAIAIFTVNSLLRRFVVRPLSRMAQVAEVVSTGDMAAEFDYAAKDEVGEIAKAFNRMKVSLGMAMQMLEQSQNEP
jgi:HAMP domain-containing protein